MPVFCFFFNPYWLYAELWNGNPKGWEPHSHGVWVTPGERLTFRNMWEPERMECKWKPHLSDEDISCLVSLLQSILTYATSFASPDAPLRCAGQLLLTLSYRWKKPRRSNCLRASSYKVARHGRNSMSFASRFTDWICLQNEDLL